MMDVQQETQTDTKRAFDISIKLSKAQVLALKKFNGLSNTVDDKVAIKSLILSIANGKIRKIGY